MGVQGTKQAKQNWREEWMIEYAWNEMKVWNHNQEKMTANLWGSIQQSRGKVGDDGKAWRAGRVNWLIVIKERRQTRLSRK